MRRNVLTLALAAAFGLLLIGSDAQACHKRKCKSECAPAPAPVCAPAPAPVCEPAPACEPAPCAKPKKKLFGCFKKKAAYCEPAPVYEAPCAAPVTYAHTYTTTVTYAAPQATYAAPQAPVAAPAPQAPAKVTPIAPAPQAPSKQG
jgi:hypothetical protein